MFHRRLIVCGLAVAASAHSARAASVVFGGPALDVATSTGFENSGLRDRTSVGNGAAVGSAEFYSAGGYKRASAIRWTVSGGPEELGTIGILNNPNDTTGAAGADAVNTLGNAFGFANKYNSLGDHIGTRAVRWDAGSTTPVELGDVGVPANGSTHAEALAANDSNVAVGTSSWFVSGAPFGNRAVRWDANGVATLLGNVSAQSNGATSEAAQGINNAGTVIGSGAKYNFLGQQVDTVAIRWDAGTTVPTLLASLTPSGTGAYAHAYSINDAGIIVGESNKLVASVGHGFRAVRWDAGGTTPTELGNLGTHGDDQTNTHAYAVNAEGAAVGAAEKYQAGVLLGTRAVRWTAGGTAATELGNLGTDPAGVANSLAVAINNSGIAVGNAEVFSGSTNLGTHAVAWNPDGVAIDLNSLIDPASGWVLLKAQGISSTNWVNGVGMFDADGAGPLAAYSRGFLLQVPEPTTLATIGIAIACASAAVSFVTGSRLGQLGQSLCREWVSRYFSAAHTR